MLYYAYDWQQALLEPLRTLAGGWAELIEAAGPPPPNSPQAHVAAACRLIADTRVRHRRPPFGITAVESHGSAIPVIEEAIASTPFCTLLRFRRADAPPLPRVLVAAPLSGHFATLLQATVRTLVRDHEVYITDWHNMRDVPAAAGAFGFDDYVEHLIRFQGEIGPGGHLLAVCQPCVQAVAAAAVMADQEHPSAPRSMILMAGPVDTRINPTKVNALATAKSIEWFRANLITSVPWGHAGAGRDVYPGFIQLAAFMAMQPERHLRAHFDLYQYLVERRDAEAEHIAAFYEEYFAVLDLSAEFYLETVEKVFQRAALAEGNLTYRNVKVDPGRIRRTALLTVEGERDDICAPGQTVAAHDLCVGLKPYMKRHHLQAGVGHYGVFSGRRWESQVYPVVQNFILAMDGGEPSRKASPIRVELTA
jgi:polyhydroxyalkanoate depolymerase